MKVLTARAMREADRRTIEEYGLPGVVLMETAGIRVVEVILALAPRPARVLVAAGPGNNGGDGLVIARLLQRAGVAVTLWSTVPPGGYRGDAALNYHFLMHSAFPIRHILEQGDLDHFRTDLAGTGLIVDALLGIGADRPVEGLLAELIKLINESSIPVLAVDIPSGVNADSGAVMGCAVRANWTVTFAFPKQGLLLYPGAALAGETIVGDINISDRAVDQRVAQLTTAGAVQEMLPARDADAHKGSLGRVLIVAGSTGMGGAAALAGEAALRGGAGLVYLAVPQSLAPALENKPAEVIVLSLPETSPGIIDPVAAELVLERVGGCSVLAVGPGLNPGQATAALIEELLGRCPVPMVLDAGALGALAAAGRQVSLRRALQPPVITPHAGEMARLAGLPVEEVQRTRLETACHYAREWRCITVLKGANTVLACPDGDLSINPTGDPTLATAGTGDLLTGLIASLIAQGMSPGPAARVGAFIHGLAGDLVPGGRGHTAGDVLRRFKEAFLFIEEAGRSVSPWGPFHRRTRPVKMLD